MPSFLTPISSGLDPQGPALPIPPTFEALKLQEAQGGGAASPDKSFTDELGQLITSARQTDTVAQETVESFARTEDPGRLHEAMVALSKAEISLRTVASVRNKLIDAYRELLHVTT